MSVGRGTFPRVGVFGWGVVAPKSPDLAAFRCNLASSASWLSPFHGFGPDNFLVGAPAFDFDHYRDWIDARFAPRHAQNLKEKMDAPTLFAIGSFIQALGQNPGLERVLEELGNAARVYIGTGLGSLGVVHDASIALYRRQRAWNRFWAHPDRNAAAREYLSKAGESNGAPAHPDSAEPADYDAAEEAWSAYWMPQSDDLERYLTELAAIDGLAIENGDVAAGKLSLIREKEKRRAKLQEKWRAPEPPWHVTANVIWNIHNIPAAQVSILGRISGLAFAPVAACSSFGVALKLGMDAIVSGEARAVVVGATDPPPHPLTVGAFYSARVLSANRRVSAPLTQLQGTHIAGGSVVWILGDLDYMRAKGFRPLGMEPLAVGLSSDADHIITPSSDGPRQAIYDALADAGAKPGDVGAWDLHATATPGDASEMETLRSVFPESVLVTARKGTFGHGMAAGGGWELTAQYLGYEAGVVFPTPLGRDELNRHIAAVHDHVVFDTGCATPAGLAGKLSMGIGGVNACVISRPWEAER